MKRLVRFCIVGLFLSLLGSSWVYAAESEKNGNESTVSSNRSADDWFTRPDETKSITTQSEESKTKQKDKEEKRFVELLKDNGFTYYLDTKNARWIQMPHSGNEYIADVWVKLVQTDENAEYSYPPKYFLAHYYVRPNTQQIQFLSELEVTGRPDNAIKERPYSMQNWENLVPGSVEDELYHGIVKNMKKNRLGGKSSNGMSVRDMVEEYLRISL